MQGHSRVHALGLSEAVDRVQSERRVRDLQHCVRDPNHMANARMPDGAQALDASPPHPIRSIHPLPGNHSSPSGHLRPGQRVPALVSGGPGLHHLLHRHDRPLRLVQDCDGAQIAFQTRHQSQRSVSGLSRS